ncbi:MAG TPA: DUF3987 domain-containing protein, partial [Bacteroidia bacterium]|nr:DUF3987 domain-containing protein [Bacteroidia bacterium]
AKLRIIEAKLRKAEKAETLSEHEVCKLIQERQTLERKMHGSRAMVEDCTQEALEQVLSQQDGVVALISTDGRKVVKNLLGRHRNGSMEEDIYIKAWSGDPFSVDRITRGGIPPVREPCLSMYLALQPDLFGQIFRPELVVSGFAARLLPVRACEGFDVRPSSRQYDPGILSAYSQHLRAAFGHYRACQRPLRFQMSPEARTIMDGFFHEAMARVGADPVLAPLYRRWAEQACRIAVCIQIAFWGREAHARPLHGYFAQKAVELMRWFGQQQRELLEDHADVARSALTGRLLDLVQQRGGEIPLREAWKKLGCDSSSVRAVVAANERLDLISVPTGGRPSEVIRLKRATPGL